MNNINNMNILCGCGELARLQTSWTQNNPARRFLGCLNFMDHTRNCNFFRWIDPQLPNRWFFLVVALVLDSFVVAAFVVDAFVVAALVVVVALILGALVILSLVLLL
ncbi:zinc finger, GRF-type containing protein, partial [Tanacetum coccineum]